MKDDPKGLQFYIDKFIKICTEEHENRYEAHVKAHPFLYRLAQEGMGPIHEALKIGMLKPGFFKRNEVGFQINLINLPGHEFYCTFFLPLESRDTQYSFSTMHTHGEYMLSTINAYGEGYNSLIWQKGWTMDPDTNEVEIKLQKYSKHKPLNIEFMDADTAHTVFFPEDICVTYAFWTHSKPTTAINKLRNNKILQKYKGLIKSIVKVLAPSPKSIGLLVYKEDYFYLKDGKIFKASGRNDAPHSDDFPQSFFSILQRMGFKDKKFIEDLKTKLSADDLALAKPWIEKFLNDEPIPPLYVAFEGSNSHRNVHIDEFKKIYNFELK